MVAGVLSFNSFCIEFYKSTDHVNTKQARKMSKLTAVLRKTGDCLKKDNFVLSRMKLMRRERAGQQYKKEGTKRV